MSTAIETESELFQKKEYHDWWASNKQRRKVFNLLIEGKSLLDICKDASTKIDFVKKTTSHPAFLRRLEAYLLQVFFNYQINRILALDETFKYYWDIVMGRKTVDGLGVDQASKHLVKLLEVKEVKPTVINPKQFNIILNLVKAEPEKLRDLSKEFGFNKLLQPIEKIANIKKSDNYEGPGEHLKLDKGEGDKD